MSGMNNLNKNQLPNRSRPGQHFANFSGAGAARSTNFSPSLENHLNKTGHKTSSGNHHAGHAPKLSTTQKVNVALFTSPHADAINSNSLVAIGASPAPDVYFNRSQVSNGRLTVSKGGVAQNRQYKKSVGSKNNSSGIVQISSQNGKQFQMMGATSSIKRRN